MDDPTAHQRVVEFTYTNYRGETAGRRVVPVEFVFRASQWHPAPQWLMVGYDLDRLALREFAMKDIREWRPAADAR